MRLQEAAKMLCGSIAVYVIMAACAASSTVNPGFYDGGANDSSAGGAGSGSGVDGSRGGSGSGSSGGGVASGSGTDGSGGGSGSDGPSILDVITDPVPTANADVNQSGSRLKAKYYAGADGSQQFLFMFHDTLLNTDCSFSKASDGTIRCMPVSSGVTIGSGSFFSDAACSQPLGGTLTCQPAPNYITTTTAGSTACASTTQTYAAGPLFTGTAYTGSPASCTAISAAVDASAYSNALATAYAAYSFYTLGAQIQPPNPSQYVLATVQTQP